MLLALLGLHALLSVAAPVVARRWGRAVFAFCALAPLATLGYSAAQAPAVLGGEPVTQSVSWLPGLDLAISLRLDAFAVAMVALVSGIGVLIFAYSAWYFSAQEEIGRFAGTLLAFAGAMLGLVLADHLLVLYVFWELTSVTSYLLIGFTDDKGSARAAALQALLTTSMGGLAMLAGFVVLGEQAGTYAISELLANPPAGTAAAVGALLVLLGAATKSAQVPFHTWLPAAMTAPTPVSAYLHSATMVKAGVYLLARLAPVFAALALWRPAALALGLATMLVGGYRALRQDDLKLLLAYGTVSQLGFLITLFGVGVPELTYAGVVLLLAHAAFKATLFLVVGIIDHSAHTRDRRRLSGLGRQMPALAVIATIAGASMAGLPPLLGFIAKEEAYAAFLESHLGVLGVVGLAGIVLGSVFTVAYTWRFLTGAFATKPHPGPNVVSHVEQPAPAFAAPAAVLAVLTVLLGVVPSLLSPLVEAAAVALTPSLEPHHLALWHGFNPALGLSALTLAAGALLIVSRERVETLQARVPDVRGADDAYRGSLWLLNRTADMSTGVLQNGSLPIYAAVVLLTMVVLPAGALLGHGGLGPVPVFAESALQVAVGVGVALTALVLVAVDRRFTAVLLLSAVGYGVAMLFVIQGAPDLALTQLLIETLTMIVFVLVMRHLPARFQPLRWRLGQALRLTVAASVGVFVMVFALIARAARTAEPISTELLALALPEGHGRNVVNVILVDFRGFDTFGEITVLTVAAIGVATLVRVCAAERGQARAAAEKPRREAPVRSGPQDGAR